VAGVAVAAGGVEDDTAAAALDGEFASAVWAWTCRSGHSAARATTSLRGVYGDMERGDKQLESSDGRRAKRTAERHRRSCFSLGVGCLLLMITQYLHN